jgi:hypothetical protein
VVAGINGGKFRGLAEGSSRAGSLHDAGRGHAFLILGHAKSVRVEVNTCERMSARIVEADVPLGTAPGPRLGCFRDSDDSIPVTECVSRVVAHGPDTECPIPNIVIRNSLFAGHETDYCVTARTGGVILRDCRFYNNSHTVFRTSETPASQSGHIRCGGCRFSVGTKPPAAWDEYCERIIYEGSNNIEDAGLDFVLDACFLEVGAIGGLCAVNRICPGTTVPEIRTVSDEECVFETRPETKPETRIETELGTALPAMTVVPTAIESAPASEGAGSGVAWASSSLSDEWRVHRARAVPGPRVTKPVTVRKLLRFPMRASVRSTLLRVDPESHLISIPLRSAGMNPFAWWSMSPRHVH